MNREHLPLTGDRLVLEEMPAKESAEQMFRQTPSGGAYSEFTRGCKLPLPVQADGNYARGTCR